MKKFRKLLLLILIIPCAFIFTACSFSFGESKVYVTGIEKTDIIGNTQTYTVTYSDGTTSSFEVKNGENGQDMNIADLFALGVSINIYTNDRAGFEQFINSLNLSGNTAPTSISTATNKALMSAVKIYSHHKVYNRYSTGENNNSTITNTGAGVIYRMDEDYSYIITNYHVVYDERANTTSNHIASKIVAYQYGVDESIYKVVNEYGNPVFDTQGYPKTVFSGDVLECTYVGGEAVYDLAVLKISTPKILEINPNARAVDIASGYSVSNTAIAIGNPEGEGISVTQGIISVDSEEIDIDINGYKNIMLRELRVDTAINGGNSGGGLFNDKGELIGIVNAKLSAAPTNISASIENMGYALPYEDVIAVVDNILENYHQTGDACGINVFNLGLNYIVKNSHAVYDPVTSRLDIVNDLVVQSTNGVANFLRLSSGDIVTAVEIQRSGETTSQTYRIERAYKLRNIILSLREGDTFRIIYKRNNVETTTAIYSASKSNFSPIVINNHINNYDSIDYLYKV